MKGIIKIVVFVVLAGVSFGASYLLSGLFSGGDDSSTSTAATETQEAMLAGSGAPLGGITPSIHMKEGEVNRLIKDLRLKMDQVAAKEGKLQKREKRLELAEKLLLKQAKDLETLRMELVTPLTDLREAKAKLDATRIDIDQEEQVNLKKIAGQYNVMNPVEGSAILVGMCKNNQEDDVVKILYYMEERPAAGMLTALTDTNMAARLVGKLKTIKAVKQKQGG